MTNYIYLLYGTGDDCYVEAAYSIGTLRKRIDADTDRIIVFTDQPERVKDWPVVCESIASQLAAMRGKANFSHRAKLCVILKCFEKYPGNVVYLDSDTSVRGDIVKLAERLSAGTAIMHAFECRNPEIGLSGFHTQLAGGISYRFSPASQMYNAGIIGLHHDCCGVVNLALELCDAMLEFGGTRIHTTEQFSISEALRISDIKILEARGVVTHYMVHRFYLRVKIYEMMLKTGRQPWQFENPVPYSRIKVYWLRKFGYYKNPRNKLK
jgi:hypothetical protein